MNYHNRYFKAAFNSDNGEVTSDLIFHYKQEGNILTCQYAGGSIVSGQLMGIVAKNGKIDMRYHQINDQGRLMTGSCTSTPELMSNGKIRLRESWQWTSGDLSKGESILEEVDG